MQKSDHCLSLHGCFRVGGGDGDGVRIERGDWQQLAVDHHVKRGLEDGASGVWGMGELGFVSKSYRVRLQLVGWLDTI